MLGESIGRRQRRRSAPESKRPRMWKRLLLWLPIALAVPFAIGYFIAIRVWFPPPAVTGVGVPVPELVGRSAEEAQRALAAAGLGPIEVMELPHPSAPAGHVVAQTPLAGQQLHAGAPVQVALSSGRPRVTVPDVMGFSADRAESLLRRSGFEVARTIQESMAPAGRVVRTEPEPGQERVLPATVMLFVSTGPLVVDIDTMVVDTTAPQSGPRGW